MRKGQGRRPLLDACGLRPLRWHCITHWHDSVIDITKWSMEYFQKPLSVNTIRRAMCRCQLKPYLAKIKPHVNMVQKRRSVLWAKASSMLSAFSSTASIFDGMGVHKCIRYGQLACFGRHYECWKVYKCFGATYAPLQMMSISAGQFKTTYCSYYNSMALYSRRVRVLNWPACSPYLSHIENIWRIIKQKISVKDDHKLFSSWKPISGKNGTKFQHQNSVNSLPRCQDVFKLIWKEEEMLHHGKHAPIPILRPVAGIKFEMN